jgi:uncharacterized protein (TIGR02391 family)
MELNHELSESVCSAVREHYNNGHYRDAVLDAVGLMTEMLRAKAGVDGDGVKLCSAALGGDTPRLKLNRMETQSQIDEQRGLEDLVRGIYRAIRDPRVHEITYRDDQKTGDSLLVLLDYIIARIETTQTFFDMNDFECRVFDPLFAERSDYADLLVEQIPTGEILDLARDVFAKRAEHNPKKIRFFLAACVRAMNESMQLAFLSTLSGAMISAADEVTMADVIQYVAPHLWPKLERSAKLRAENMMVQSVKQGSYNLSGTVNAQGAFGTWASRFGARFELKGDLAHALIGLLDTSWHSQNYVGQYFVPLLPNIVEGDAPVLKCCTSLAYAILVNDARLLKSGLEKSFGSYPSKWQEVFLNIALKDREQDSEYYDRLKTISQEPLFPFS